MTNNAKKIAEEIHGVTEGLKRIEVAERPPRVKWGDIFLTWDIKKQNKYLMKFAEAMNHAADVIQQERDTLGQFLEKKEQQLIAMQAAVDANNQMLQSEVTRMNTDRQAYNKHVADLNSRIREMEGR